MFFFLLKHYGGRQEKPHKWKEKAHIEERELHPSDESGTLEKSAS